MFLDSCDTAERICDIQITQTNETNETGLRLVTILDSKDSLRLSKTYRQSELNIILRSVKRVDQVALIQFRNSATDKPAYEVLINFLIKENLVSYITLSYVELYS